MFKKIFSGITRTRDQIAGGLSGLIGRRGRLSPEALDNLEETLIAADVGFATTEAIVAQLKKARAENDDPTAVIRAELVKALTVATPKKSQGQPHVILMVGVNGAGKTTTIGKLAARFSGEGKKVLLAAGDTFRAAAVAQLKGWGERLDLPVIAQDTGSDSASVLFDALDAARARGADVLLADTAGRLQNKGTLMEELKKIARVMQKLDPTAPHETLLVLDATTGQNAVSQLKEFTAAVAVDGLVVTKLDGTARGGIVFRLVSEFGVPVRWVGVGEQADDLQPFDAEDFVDAVLGIEVDKD